MASLNLSAFQGLFRDVLAPYLEREHLGWKFVFDAQVDGLNWIRFWRDGQPETSDVICVPSPQMEQAASNEQAFKTWAKGLFVIIERRIARVPDFAAVDRALENSPPIGLLAGQNSSVGPWKGLARVGARQLTVGTLDYEVFNSLYAQAMIQPGVLPTPWSPNDDEGPNEVAAEPATVALMPRPARAYFDD